MGYIRVITHLDPITFDPYPFNGTSKGFLPRCRRLPEASGRKLGEALEAGEAKIQVPKRLVNGVDLDPGWMTANGTHAIK